MCNCRGAWLLVLVVEYKVWISTPNPRREGHYGSWFHRMQDVPPFITELLLAHHCPHLVLYVRFCPSAQQNLYHLVMTFAAGYSQCCITILHGRMSESNHMRWFYITVDSSTPWYDIRSVYIELCVCVCVCVCVCRCVCVCVWVCVWCVWVGVWVYFPCKVSLLIWCTKTR